MTLLLLAGGFMFASAIVVLILYVLGEIVDLWGKPLLERTPVDASPADDGEWRWPA